MTEDVSLSIRIAVTVELCALLVAVAASMTALGIHTFNNFRDSYIDATNTSEAAIVASLTTKKSVEAPTIYKALIGNDMVSGYTMDYIDSTNPNTLPLGWNKASDSATALEPWITPYNAARRFKVSIRKQSDGTFWMNLEEVVR